MEGATALSTPAEHQEWVEELRKGGPMRAASILATPANSWACPPGASVSVRGPDYCANKVKVPGGDSLLHPLAFDFLQGGPSRIAHIMQHPHCRVRAALDAALLAHPHSLHQPFVWAFNIQLGSYDNHSFVFYYITFSEPSLGSLTQRFLDGDDTFRNSRLKGMICFTQAPRLVQVLVAKRWPVCVVGKFLTCNYFREKNYMEVDMDAGSSMLVRTAVKLTFSLLPMVVADIAFVLEGNNPDELPERILGVSRFIRLEPSSATYTNMSL